MKASYLELYGPVGIMIRWRGMDVERGQLAEDLRQVLSARGNRVPRGAESPREKPRSDPHRSART